MTFSLQCKQVQEKKNEMTYKLINGKQTIFCNIENKSISFICLNEVTYIKTQSKYGLIFFFNNNGKFKETSYSYHHLLLLYLGVLSTASILKCMCSFCFDYVGGAGNGETFTKQVCHGFIKKSSL